MSMNSRCEIRTYSQNLVATFVGWFGVYELWVRDWAIESAARETGDITGGVFDVRDEVFEALKGGEPVLLGNGYSLKAVPPSKPFRTVPPPTPEQMAAGEPTSMGKLRLSVPAGEPQAFGPASRDMDFQYPPDADAPHVVGD